MEPISPPGWKWFFHRPVEAQLLFFLHIALPIYPGIKRDGAKERKWLKVSPQEEERGPEQLVLGHDEEARWWDKGRL